MPAETSPDRPPELRLGVNIDHVATLRNARGGAYPDPVRAARTAAAAGADSITAHLREDRRHIRDEDIDRLARDVELPLNLEMAATDEMREIALKLRPHAVCLVPEKREERTTEGGLDAHGLHNGLSSYVKELGSAGSRVSLFIAPDARQIDAAARLGVPVIELHVGPYCDAVTEGDEETSRHQLDALHEAALRADAAGLEVHAGHGITFATAPAIARLPHVRELNIGHFLIAESVFIGLGPAVTRMREAMAEGLAQRGTPTGTPA